MSAAADGSVALAHLDVSQAAEPIQQAELAYPACDIPPDRNVTG